MLSGRACAAGARRRSLDVARLLQRPSALVSAQGNALGITRGREGVDSGLDKVRKGYVQRGYRTLMGQNGNAELGRKGNKTWNGSMDATACNLQGAVEGGEEMPVMPRRQLLFVLYSYMPSGCLLDNYRCLIAGGWSCGLGGKQFGSLSLGRAMRHPDSLAVRRASRQVRRTSCRTAATTNSSAPALARVHECVPWCPMLICCEANRTGVGDVSIKREGSWRRNSGLARVEPIWGYEGTYFVFEEGIPRSFSQVWQEKGQEVVVERAVGANAGKSLKNGSVGRGVRAAEDGNSGEGREYHLLTWEKGVGGAMPGDRLPPPSPHCNHPAE